jgi:3-isopropylmalate/(R)-2-methylmalate dehydratase small subunit
MKMKRRGFLTMLGAAVAAPALPAVSSAPAAAAYNRYMYGLAVFHARTRAHVSARGIAYCLKVSTAQAEAMISEMTKNGLVKPVFGAGGNVRAVSNILNTDTWGQAGVTRRAQRRERGDARQQRQTPNGKTHEGESTMDKFTKLSGIAAPMPLVNIDTDMIIPKQFLKTIKRSGLGVNLFDEMRYDDDGKEIPDFVLNKPQYRDAEILVAGENFGCGSSREHAPWAIKDFGIRCVIAPSYADIFYNNCFKNGILPVALPQEQVDVLMKDAEKGSNARIEIDLDAQTITSSDGDVFSFEVDAFKKHCLMNGLDDIGLTMKKAASIDSFEASAATARPWI